VPTAADVLAAATILVKRHEGCRLDAYPDPLSGGDPWTIGWGSTGHDVCEGAVWTQPQADEDLEFRLVALISRVAAALPWTANLDVPRAAVLVDMAYNLGLAGMLGFTHTLTMILGGQWEDAATAMLASRWATQVPNRAEDDAQIIRDGVLT
jgi:lysozyme